VSALGQKTTLAEHVFIPRHDVSKCFSYSSKCIIMSGKKFLANQSCQKFGHIWLQDSELKSWLNTCCLSFWLKKAFCEVCNNAIIAKHSLKGVTGSKSTQIRPSLTVPF